MSHIRRMEPFLCIDEVDRVNHLAAYRRHLDECDGDVVLDSRTLTRREERMQRIEAWPAPPSVDPATSDAEQVALRREWILAAAKANEGERYGVEIEIARFHARGGFPGFDSPDLMLRVLMQESYHCRILAELCRAGGVAFEAGTPAWPTRAFLHVIGAVPPTARWAIVLAGECVGAALFRRLIDSLGACGFAAPEEARLRMLIREIWVDEILHVAFLRAVLSRAGLLLARALLPVVAVGVFRQVPDLRNIGCTPRAILADLKIGLPVPDELSWLQTGSELDNSSVQSPAAA